MVIRTCKLIFKDGASVVARVVTSSPLSSVPVEWTGSVDRIPMNEKVSACHDTSLKALFKVLAKKLDAKFEESVEGTYDRGER